MYVRPFLPSSFAEYYANAVCQKQLASSTAVPAVRPARIVEPSISIEIQRPRHVLERERPTVDLEAFRPCLVFAQANSCHLRVGEDHFRHGRQVQHRIATRHIARGPRSRGRRDVDILRWVGAVAGSVDMRDGGPHVFVDDDGARSIDGDTRYVKT